MDLMKNTKVAIGALVISFACLFTGCAKLPNDGANTKKYHLADMNRVRYLEVFVVGGNGITGNLIANVYNTSLVPDRDPSVKDTVPDAWAKSLNTHEIEERFGALRAAINGPKLWMLDWVDIPLGASEEFNGKNIPWCTELHPTKTELKEMGKFAYSTGI